MAELQRVNPQAAKAIGVQFNVPNGSAAKIGVAQAAMQALGVKAQGRGATADALRHLAGAVENLGGTIATIEGDKVQKNITMATDLDMRAYSLALADAQREASEEFRAQEYGTFAEANEAYADLIKGKMDAVTAKFFPQSTIDRVPGSYFRYAKELNLTPNDPRLQQMQLDTAHAGAEQMHGKWMEEQAKVNSAIINDELALLRRAKVRDPEKYKQLIQQYAPEMFISKEGLDKWANAQVTLVYQEAITELANAGLQSMPAEFQKTLQANLQKKKKITGKDGKEFERNYTFEEALKETEQELNGAKHKKFDEDELVQEFKGRKEYKYLEGWYDETMKKYDAGFSKSMGELKSAACKDELRKICEEAGISTGKNVISLPAAHRAQFISKFAGWGEKPERKISKWQLLNVKMADGSTFVATRKDLYSELWRQITFSDFAKEDGMRQAEAIIDASEWLSAEQQDKLKTHMAQCMDFCANAKEHEQATKGARHGAIVSVLRKHKVDVPDDDLRKVDRDYRDFVNQVEYELNNVKDASQLLEYVDRAWSTHETEFANQQTRTAVHRKIANVSAGGFANLFSKQRAQLELEKIHEQEDEERKREKQRAVEAQKDKERKHEEGRSEAASGERALDEDGVPRKKVPVDNPADEELPDAWEYAWY